MGRLSPEGERQEAEAYAELAAQPKVHMKDDDCPNGTGHPHTGDIKCHLCGIVYGTPREQKITRNELLERFGEVVPNEVVAFLFSDETKGMTVAEARAEIDKRWPKRPKAEGPKEAENPNWAAVLKLARDTLTERKSPEYCDDSDMPRYIYEAVMETVYPGYFAWARSLR